MLPLSAALQLQAQNIVQRFQETQGAELKLSAAEQSVLASSDFVSDMLLGHPEWLVTLRQQPPVADEWQHYAAWLQDELEEVQDEAQLMRVLRLFRRESGAHCLGAGSAAMYHARNATTAECSGRNADRQRS